MAGYFSLSALEKQGLKIRVANEFYSRKMNIITIITDPGKFALTYAMHHKKS